MKGKSVILVFLILLIPIFQSYLVTGPITGNVTSFSDSESSKISVLTKSVEPVLVGNISIPKRAVITAASMNVSVMSSSVYEYPKDVFLDIGNDSKFEWGFGGKGYGQVGQQRYFMDNKTYSRLKITGNSYNNNASFRLPKNATVTSTNMLIDGRANVSGAEPSQNWNLLNSLSSTKVVANITGGKVYFTRIVGTPTYFDIYDPISKSWSTSSNCNTNLATTGHAITLAGSDIYTTTTNNKLYRYHTNNDTWIDLGLLPTSATMITYGGLTYDHADRIYAVQYNWGASTSIAFYYYAISNSTWIKLKSPLRADCAYPTLCYFNNRVYLVNRTYYLASQQKCKEIQFYAPNNNTWFRLSDAPIHIATRLCTDNYNLFGATSEGQILKYDVLTDTWAITGKKTSNLINIVGGLAYSDRLFYLCRYNPSSGYYNITGVGGGDFPVDSFLDIGDNGGAPEWNIVGEFNTTDYVNDFTTEMNSLILLNPTSYIDAYGNEFVDIVINVTSSVTSTFMIREMTINYTYTEVVDLNPFTGNLVNSLNELVPDTGEGDILLPFMVYSTHLGSINISNISIDYYIPDLTNNRFQLITGQGMTGRTVHADYMDYTFLVNITNRWGYTDVKDVIMYLDVDGENLQLIWDEATDTFSELRDPYNLITLNAASCTSTHNSVENWTLEFVVRFDWAYPNETYELCALKTTNDTAAFVFNEFSEVYRVENDLEFVGDLNVTAMDQGNLSGKPASQHWVSSSETITWTNLTVVYEATTDIYPDDKNFNVTIFDDDSDSWMNTSSSGQPFIIQTTSDPTSDYNDIHTMNITNIPGLGEDVSNWSFLIRTDNDGPLVPPNFICHADGPFDSETVFDDDTEIFVSWNDASDGTGSQVDYYAMEFNNAAPTTPVASESNAFGVEGLSTFYVRARDNVGNWGVTGSASIFIDITNLTFSDPTPDPESWQTNLTLTCGITILDTSGSGVEIDSVQYRYIEEGDINTADWRNYNGPGTSGESVDCVQNITFETDGDDKKVQWRARDLAGNGRIVMEPAHKIRIDSLPPTMEYDQPDLSKWLDTLNPQIKFYLNDTLGSGIDLSSLQYAVSTTGLDGFGGWKVLNGVGGGDSVYCTIDETLDEGKLNYIKIQASDIAGNIVTFAPKRVRIDSSVPEFLDPAPIADAWVNNVDVLCNITIHDQISSIDVSTIKYQFSTNGTTKYDYWKYVQDEYLTPEPDGQSFKISLNVKFNNGVNNYIRWTAIDLAGNEVISDHYNVQVDIIPIGFSSEAPTEEDWYNSVDVPCSIILDDSKGSGVVGSTVEYSISTSGLSGFSGWTDDGLELIDLTTSGTRSRNRADASDIFETVQATVTPTFTAGSSNYIKWHAKDLADNLVASGGYQVNVDLDEVFFLNPEPREDIVYDELELRCKITVVDIGGSGVNPGKVEYRYSNTGLLGFREWSNESITWNKVDDEFFIDLPFYPGDQNRLQWRATDNAGNGPTESAIYNVTINSPPTAVMDEPKELTKYTSNDNIFFSANSTIDPDPEDKLAYDWSSNISKFLGDTKTFHHKLPAGVHQIMLTVSDNHGHTVSTTKIIAVIKYRVDTDSDGIPDYLDSDDDNDQVPDSEDAFPLDSSEWKDTDSDGVGNNEDTDDDGDNYMDIEDAYPENPDKWEKEKEAGLLSMENILIIMLIVIIILIGVGVGAIRHRSKKRAERAAEAAEMASKMPATAAVSGSMLSPRIQDAQVEMVSGGGGQPYLGGVPTQTTPLLPGSVHPDYGGGVSPTQPAESPQVIPQHLVSTPDKQIPSQTVQTYMPQPTTPGPAQEPGPMIYDQPLETTPTPPTEPTSPTAQPSPTPEPPQQPQQEPPVQPTTPEQPSPTQEQEPEKTSIVPGLTPAQQKAQGKEEPAKEEEI